MWRRWIRGSHYNLSVVSRIHGHRRNLTQGRCWSLRRRLGGGGGSGAHQVVERRSALNECVKSFLDTWVVKIDT